MLGGVDRIPVPETSTVLKKGCFLGDLANFQVTNC